MLVYTSAMQLKIRELRQISSKIFSLVFEKPENFNFYAGQYLDITLDTKDRFKSREFTISSSPTEKSLVIITKKGVSEFKKTLEKLQAGDSVEITHPAGTFTLDETEPAVFIAGGIGITPFRSILKDMVDKKLTTTVTLIYSNSDESFLFEEELELWKELLNLTVHYVVTKKTGRLDKEKLKRLTIDHKPSTIYYLAGRTSFVDSIEKILLDLKVDPINIRYDRFTGYY